MTYRRPHSFPLLCFFFFNDTATTEIYTLSLHDALPICRDVAEHRVEAHGHQLGCGPVPAEVWSDRPVPFGCPRVQHRLPAGTGVGEAVQEHQGGPPALGLRFDPTVVLEPNHDPIMTSIDR